MRIVLVIAALVVAVGGVFLWRAVSEPVVPDVPSPFVAGDLGKGLVACDGLCQKQDSCGVVHDPDCKHTCESMLELQVAAAKPCAGQVQSLLDCWWRATQRCGPADACAAEVGKVFDCACTLPNAPASCTLKLLQRSS
jgi:hypothetical protein